MFSQIKIRQEDQKAQRFLWRDGDKNQKIKIYTMTSMIFGAACSPCCAEFIKNFNVNQYKNEMPKSANAVLNNMYVDDLVVSYDGEEEAISITKGAIRINAAGGFNLRNFVSNSKYVQESLNGCAARLSVINMEPQAKPDKILGMYWNTATDCFEFHFKFHLVAQDVLNGKRTPTKRELLGIAMAIYDPFGFLANCTTSVKLILQATWKMKVQWDDELPKELSKQWYRWWHTFQGVKDFVLPRCYSPMLPVADEVQLHMFVDASSSAYAAVAYLRIKRYEQIHVALLGTRSKCAPLKGMSIPRLELQAAVLGCRFKDAILGSVNCKVHNVVFWNDSTTVVQWIKSTTRQFKQFVAHRIAEITTSSCPEQWNWLSTKLNIADEATRLSLTYEADSLNWKMGPEFLRCSEDKWPQGTIEAPIVQADEEELKVVLVVLDKQKTVFNRHKYSSYERLKRVVGWVKRFIENLKLCHFGSSKQFGELKTDELHNAEVSICKHVQGEMFSGDIAILQSKGTLPRFSSLHALTPFLDQQGVLRVNGRIDAAYCLPLEARRPIIMAKDHHVTFLIMRHYHVRTHHLNDAIVINECRQKFWNPRTRS